jgi:hypothetical protein
MQVCRAGHRPYRFRRCCVVQLWRLAEAMNWRPSMNLLSCGVRPVAGWKYTCAGAAVKGGVGALHLMGSGHACQGTGAGIYTFTPWTRCIGWALASRGLGATKTNPPVSGWVRVPSAELESAAFWSPTSILALPTSRQNSAVSGILPISAELSRSPQASHSPADRI